jgi:hypothetical protein
LDQLSPESRAVLSLVLLQSRSYADIADLLRLPEDEVRDRAHAAAEDLVAATDSLAAGTRSRIIDYMLGEQSVSERAETRAELGASIPARMWATELGAALAPLAKAPLPAIPGEPVTPAPPAVVPTPEPARGRVAVAPPTPRPSPIAQPRPLFAAPPGPPAARLRHAPERSVPAVRIVVPALVAVAAIVVLIVALSGGGSSGTHHSAGSRTIHKLVLEPAGANHSALGAADLVRQKGGNLLLLLQGRGLAPNRHDAYAVWLFNTPGDARLLGFVSPAVGSDGTFSSGVQLPDDAFRFHALIVTLEQSSQPTTPGPMVLRAPLSLS